MFLPWRSRMSELKAAKAPGERNLELCSKWVSIRRWIHIWSSVLFSKVHPCQEHHQRHNSGGNEDTHIAQLPWEWLRSLLGVWAGPWEKHMSKRGSKVQGVRRMQDMHFYKYSEETLHLAIPSAKPCWEYFEWLTNQPKGPECTRTAWIPSTCCIVQCVIIDSLLYTWKAKTPRQPAQNEQAEMRPGRDRLAQGSAVVCHNTCASQSALLRRYEQRAWVAARLGCCY